MQTLHSLHRPPAPFPAKVTYKNSGKNASKTYKCTVTVKNPGVRLVENPAVVVNEKTNVVTKVWPKSATVEYKSGDETIATVDVNGEVTGVKAGKATITATMTCGTKVVTKTTEVTVRAYEFQSVAQKEATVLEAVITGDIKSVKVADIKITNTSSNGNITVKGCAVDRTDSTKLLITTYQSMVDGKEYKVVIDGVEKTFTATDGKVASVGLEKTTIVANTLTDINAVTMDANGVIIGKYAYPSTSAGGTAYVETVINVVNGYTSGKQLILYNVGDTATATVTWHSGVRDANGVETGNIKLENITITAVAEEVATTDGWTVKVGKNDASYGTVKETKLAVGDPDKAAYIQMMKTTSTGTAPSTDLTGYTVESSDLNSLIVTTTAGDLATGKIFLEPKKAGTVYLVIKKNGSVVETLPVEIVAARTLSGLSIDRSSVTLSADVGESVIVKAALKDQHGEDMTANGTDNLVAVSVTAFIPKGTSTPVANNGGLDAPVVNYNNGKAEVTVKAVKNSSATEGTYTLVFTDRSGRYSQTLRVTLVKVAGTTGSQTGYELGMPTSTVDTTITKDTAANATLTAIVYETTNGVKAQALTCGAIAVELRDSYGRLVDQNSYKPYGVDAASDVVDNSDATNGVITITLAEKDGSLKLPAGTYTLVVKENDHSKFQVTRNIVVTDSQPAVSCTVDKVSGATIGNCMTFMYEGKVVYHGDAAGTEVTYYGLKDPATELSAGNTNEYVDYAIIKVKVGTGSNYTLQKVDIKTTFIYSAN